MLRQIRNDGEVINCKMFAPKLGYQYYLVSIKRLKRKAQEGTVMVLVLYDKSLSLVVLVNSVLVCSKEVNELLGCAPK